MRAEDCYFIAGVLVMDMTLWNKRGITRQLGRFMTRMTSQQHICSHAYECMHAKIKSLRVLTRKQRHPEWWMSLKQQIERTWNIYFLPSTSQPNELP